MSSQQIALTYKWTAKPGKEAELKAMYESVGQESKANEPDLSRMDLYEVPGSGVIIDEVFQDGAALGEHLNTTAAHHFPSLLEIADPGPFFFCGDVPDELVQVLNDMNMGAIFATHVFGFSRKPTEAA